MTSAGTARFIDLPFAEPKVIRSARPDGSAVLGSGYTLADHPPHMLAYLDRWAEAAPDRVFLAERDAAGGWRELTYGDAAERSGRLAQTLLDRGHDPARPIMMLCDATVNMGVLKLAAMRVGIPFVPVSPAYSLMSETFEKLRGVVQMIRPGLVYVSKLAMFARALDAVGLTDVPVICDDDTPDRKGVENFDNWLGAPPGPAVAEAFAGVNGDTLAKILLTSGSTGTPKGVLNPQRMLCSNGVAIDQLWPFLGARPPVLVDWLPWSHTFGTNFNLGQILRHGGTMYIDAGKPAPGRIETTLANLRAVRPNLLYNVPRGFDMLLPHLEADDDFAAHVFGDLDIIFYAGAALPKTLWDRLEALSVKVRGARVPILSSLGATETGPCATLTHWGPEVANSIGLPIPGSEVKLVPSGDKTEIRVRGPNVTPGYFGAPDLTAAAFDEEGFFRLGDAVKYIDEARPERGLLFDGRVAENFKLLTGTWVAAGLLRIAAISAGAPVIQDAVVTGHDREEVGLLVFPSPAGCRAVAGDAPEDEALDDLIHREAVRAALAHGLARHNADNPGSSTRIARVLITTEPPSIDGNEITDKGYLNQRAVLARRADLVERLYAEPAGADVVLVDPLS
ncbi:MAG TPA: feruloyl-CoA synthase [Alphaproteobacteria bacterium]|nr:feruloyl-CoA synthase [Alphaproteobacteria bacterium]